MIENFPVVVWILSALVVAETTLVVILSISSEKHNDIMRDLDLLHQEYKEAETRYYNKIFKYNTTMERVDEWIKKQDKRKARRG